MSVFSSGSSGGKTANGGGGHRESERVREDIDATHRRLERLLGELDRRRREALDIRLQMRRHPLIFAAGAAAAPLDDGTPLAPLAPAHRRRKRLAARRLVALDRREGGDCDPGAPARRPRAPPRRLTAR
jgi:hypothetical protein